VPELPRLLRRFRRQKAPRRTESADEDLALFFTDAEEARSLFDKLVTADEMPRRILIVHGEGAVGKSSLLKMYRLACRRRKVPVALVGGEDASSAVDLLDAWSVDLAEDHVELATFRSSIGHYRQLQAKVQAEASKAGSLEADAADQLTKLGARATMAAVGAIPGMGPIAAAAGPEAVEAILNLIRATLSKADFDFFTDPTKRLTDDFLVDVNHAAERKRLVLMLDTFEQVTALGDWLRELVQEFPENLLVVIAGKQIPEWDREWPGWVARREAIELTEMSDEHVATLVRQYYALFGRGEPDEALVQDVVHFARGLPMAATTAVRLRVNYQLGTLEPTDAAVAAQLADELLKGVPPDLRPVFEAAAVLRYFNADSLAALLEAPDGSAMYDELRRWPFTRARREGLAVHETMREVINGALRARSPQQFTRLHERAATYYEQLLAHADGEERDRLQREWLYHSLRADEAKAIRSFRDVAEQLVRAQWIARLRGLASDANTYPLELENSRLWRRYYAARLEQLVGHTATAESEYRTIAEEDDAEATLRAYALCDLGAILATLDRLAEPDGERAAVAAVEQSLKLQPELDAKLATNHITLMNVSNARADWAESIEHVRAARDFAQSANDAYALVMADRLQAALYGLQGDWPGFLRTRRQYVTAVGGLGDVPALQMHAAYFAWPLVFMGRISEAKASSEEALEIAIRLDERELMITIRESVALALGMEQAYAEASTQFEEAYNFYENFHKREEAEQAGSLDRYIRALLSFRGLVALREGKLDQADADLRRALDVKRAIGDRIGIPEVHVWRGQLSELRRTYDQAETEYDNALDLKGVNRHYFNCAALTGLVRVRQAQGRSDESRSLLAEAEELALRYDYNDLLASLRLSQGHLAWDEGENASATALERYRQALLHALRFNRFLLDEVLGGRPEGTPLRPILSSCLERDRAGQEVMSSIREWWTTAVDDAELPAEPVSPLPMGVQLRDAERTARAREPGTGAAQPTVLEQIESALGSK
jgi:ATP/maltotriose-dependent transcriptional regulator MalT